MLTVGDVQDRLKISRKAAYELVHQDDFSSIRVGERSIRIPPRAFENWLEKRLEQGLEDPENHQFKAQRGNQNE